MPHLFPYKNGLDEMEIYNLKDNIQKNSLDDRVIDDALKITDLKQGIKNPNRVNVLVNGKFEFSLDVAQVVDFGVKVGEVLDIARFEELKKASEFGKLYQRALEWTLARRRSKREVKEYLQKKVYEKKLDQNYIDRIIERLEEKKYIDDQKFAEFWVENRFVKKGVSQKRLRMELMKKGVDKDIIEEVLGGRNDEEELVKMIEKKRSRYDDEKLTQYLLRQGFPYELVKDKIQNYGKD